MDGRPLLESVGVPSVEFEKLCGESQRRLKAKRELGAIEEEDGNGVFVG
jgi:hypothetical protein